VKRFVLDASIAIAWFLDDPIPPQAIRAGAMIRSGEKALVPPLWHLEMANSFAMAKRRRLITDAELEEYLGQLTELTAEPIETDSALIGVRGALAAARKFRLSAYDAVYLETARAHGLPLASLDRQLLAACVKAGVQVLD
jgi:predicted nucleic acid-binding protein